MPFDPEAHQARMQPHADKLIAHFKNKGVDFKFDEEFDNVIFTSKEKRVAKISRHSFYRYSGIACITKEGTEKNSSITIEVTDAMFMDLFMKQIVDALLKK